MEASKVDELVSRAIDEQVDEYRRWRAEAAELVARVEALEGAVESLRAELAASVEGAARAGVAGEVDRLTADVRRQISDLGRLIVNDLGRLPKLLAASDVPAPGPGPGAAPADAADDSLDLRERPPGDEAGRGADLDLPYAVGEARRGRFRRR